MSLKMRKVLGGLVGAGALALAVASPASATISSVTPSPVVNGSTITVSGTAPSNPAIAKYALAICNTGVTIGTACSAITGSATPLTAIAPGGTISNTGITNPQDSFSNFNYTTRTPGVGSTTCLGTGSDQCAIVASYYSASNVPVGAPDVFNITF